MPQSRTQQPNLSLDAFRSFEHDGWQRVAKPYHDVFGPLTTQCTEPLLDAVGASKKTRLLDVATGPGYVAAAAARRGAIAVAVDFSAAMITEARATHPEVDFQVGDAQSLPFPDGSFDAVVNSFGMLHFPDPDQALAEAFRVLRGGGRVAFAVWAGMEKAVGFGMVMEAIQRHGDANAGLPQGPSFFRFSDAAECTRALTVAGFAEPHVSEVQQTWRFASPAVFFNEIQRSTVRTGALLRAQKPDALARIRIEVERQAAAYAKSDGSIELPMPAVLAGAVRKS